ncbi:hypothetical protein EKN06_03335 [Croceicoccus ponticola]|uniref:DUF4261 domain-containing protein n=1 Tax=Croceicoccus ponticola TaxID=2217664 RepID=A0A437H0U5_9SPHN|nr:hypothetical protein [Croceicoccus ponticola]RVQ69245.1 hypothetical protein EKN06_03335 [Croceicoccus ponticola]
MSDAVTNGADGSLADDLVFTLWFEGARPDADSVRSLFARTLVNSDTQIEVLTDSAREGAGDNGSAGATVLIGECRFTIEGLTPGVPAQTLDPSNRFGLDVGALAQAQSIRLAPQSLFVNDISVIAVIRDAVRLALALSGADRCLAVGWAAADSAMSAAYFRKVAADWLGGGPFPALGLVALESDADDGLVSKGLAVVTGQELVIAAMPGMVVADRARIAIRMIDYLVGHGPVDQVETIKVEGFSELIMAPDATGKKIYLKKSPIP